MNKVQYGMQYKISSDQHVLF